MPLVALFLLLLASTSTSFVHAAPYPSSTPRVDVDDVDDAATSHRAHHPAGGDGVFSDAHTFGSFLATFAAAVRHHRHVRGASDDDVDDVDDDARRRFVVHVVGAVAHVEGLIDWALAGPDACEGTVVVLVGRQMRADRRAAHVGRRRRRLDDDDDATWTPRGACETRWVRGEWGARALTDGLADPRERRPDLVLLFNADAYACPWRRTLGALMRVLPHPVLSEDGIDPSGAPVVITTYTDREARAISRIVGAAARDGHDRDDLDRWFAEEKLRECDDLVRKLYGEDGVDEMDDGAATSATPRGGVTMHWDATANDPEANGPGGANSHWLSFSP